MSDWQVGDLALCVDASARGGHGPYGPKLLRAGAVYTVCAITPPGRWKGGSISIGLALREVWNGSARNGDWHSSRFRRIPPHTPDAEDAETIRLLNGAPVSEPVA